MKFRNPSFKFRKFRNPSFRLITEFLFKSAYHQESITVLSTALSDVNEYLIEGLVNPSSDRR